VSVKETPLNHFLKQCGLDVVEVEQMILGTMKRVPHLKHDHPPVHNVNDQVMESFTTMERVALFITQRVGSFGFFLIVAAWSEVGVQAFRRSGVQESFAERPNAQTPERPNARPEGTRPERLTWVAFDATLPTDFVDATHLKFAQGDPTAMFQAIRVVGQLKAEVLDYHARPK